MSEVLVEEDEGPSTPLPCSTQGTPVNTPVEGDSRPEGQQKAVRDLVTSAAEQAALLAGDADQSAASSPPVMSVQDVIAKAHVSMHLSAPREGLAAPVN